MAEPAWWTDVLLSELRTVIRGFLSATGRIQLKRTCRLALAEEPEVEFWPGAPAPILDLGRRYRAGKIAAAEWAYQMYAWRSVCQPWRDLGLADLLWDGRLFAAPLVVVEASAPMPLATTTLTVTTQWYRVEFFMAHERVQQVNVSRAHYPGPLVKGGPLAKGPPEYEVLWRHQEQPLATFLASMATGYPYLFHHVPGLFAMPAANVVMLVGRSPWYDMLDYPFRALVRRRLSRRDQVALAVTCIHEWKLYDRWPLVSAAADPSYPAFSYV